MCTFAEIAGLVEQSLVEAWDPEKAASLNEEVGYYMDTHGRLAWDLTRKMTPADVVAAADQAAAGSRMHQQQAKDETQAKQFAAIQLAKKQIAAATGAVAAANVTPIAPPAKAAGRMKGKSVNKGGLFITGNTHRTWLQGEAQAKETAKDTKENKVKVFWEKWRPLAEAAEVALEKAGGDVAKAKLQVRHLNSLVVSRSGKTPTAKNNKDGALLAEAVTLCAATVRLKAVPPVKKDADAGEDEEEDESEGEEELEESEEDEEGGEEAEE